ncbi:MAG: HAMP domain-containing sensor histidine kinase [bacterium]|nr:HAMP domain-containing sensor histidine kinase [bacterium]MCY3924579.1 HAMP domain-containing sensor histidine kinase [bacterium]
MAARVSLRLRVSVAFGLGALVLAAGLSLITYELTRDNLLTRREDTSLARVLFNATQVSRLIDDETTEEELRELLQNLYTPLGARPVIRFGDLWLSANPVEFSEPQIDPLLKDTVAGGRAAQMRYVVGETPFAVIGIPYFDINAAYYEAAPLDDIAATLSSLLIALLTGSAITVLVGIGIGIWAAQRAVRPLTDIGEAAEAIAAGDLNTRLEGADPDLERLSRSFNQMASALQDRIERDARFASNVSHELRSPLMTLTASLEVLRKRQSDLPVRSQTALHLLSADLEHFKQLVADLLEISRYDVGAAALETEDFEILEFVQQAARASGQSPLLTHSVHAAGLVVRADRRRLAQVMANLLENAHNHGAGATQIHVERLESTLEIAVIDAGPGVPHEDHDIIFDRFARGRRQGPGARAGGTGLGLALVSEHVRLHGGSIRVTDRGDGQPGACFVVALPLDGQ